MELLNREFTAQSASLATGCDARKISDWSTRGLIVGMEGGGIQGRSRKFSWFNVVEIAIALELMEIGMSSVQDAFTAARRFAHIGEARAGWVGEDNSHDPTPRLPGLPHHHKLGLTFLFAWAGGSKVVLTDYHGEVKLGELTPDYHRARGFIVVNVSQLFKGICHRLALDYREVLDEAYPKEAAA